MRPNKFIQLKPGEQVIALVRRYELTLLHYWTFIFFLLSGAFFGMSWFFRHGWWGISLFSLILIIGCLYFGQLMLVKRRNVCYLTTHRLVDIEKKALFHTVVSDVPYDQIEDVSGRIIGIPGTMFRYGSVKVQTAGGRVHVIIDRVHFPLRLQNLINDLRERYVKGQGPTSGVQLDTIVKGLATLSREDLSKVNEAVKKRVNLMSAEK